MSQEEHKIQSRSGPLALQLQQVGHTTSQACLSIERNAALTVSVL